MSEKRPGKPDQPQKPNERRYGRPANGDANSGERRYGRPANAERNGSVPRAQRSHEDRRFRNQPTGRVRPAPQREDVARMLALLALQDVFRDGAYASLALNKRLRESRASVEDKRLATFIFYAAVENRYCISYILSQFAPRTPEPLTEDILHIAIAQLLFMDRVPEHAAVDEAVKQTKRLDRAEQAGFVNGVLRSLLRAKAAGEIRMPDDSMPPARRMSTLYSVPEPLVARLVAAYGEPFAEAMLAYKPDERVESVRANMTRMDAQAFRAYADGKKWSWKESVLPEALLVQGAGDLAGDPDFRAGLYSVQGAGSILAARAVQARPGMNILDACAAPGGKTCYIAEAMRGTGRVQAWDVHEHRVELIRAAAKRLGLDNVRPAVRDASAFRADLELSMDAVLVDAPCTGLGVMINKPDVKYRYQDESVAQLSALQAKILHACARYVKIGGLLVYSTCTVLPEENRLQVEHFLQTHGDFILDDDPGFLPESLRGLWEGGMIQLHAHRDGTEGFFIARMRRV